VSLSPFAKLLSDVAIFIWAGARRHVAVLIENPVSRHENVSGTVDQPVTDAGHILAERCVAVRRRTKVAVSRPIKIAVVYRGSSVNTMRVVIACGRNADRAGLDEERSDSDANHKRKAFVERHGALGVGPPETNGRAHSSLASRKKMTPRPTYILHCNIRIKLDLVCCSPGKSTRGQSKFSSCAAKCVDDVRLFRLTLKPVGEVERSFEALPAPAFAVRRGNGS
jgi:hypothetical protein